VIVTTLAYLRDGSRTLMLRRRPDPSRLGGHWNGLGGKLEPGESPERCLAREVAEESGLTVGRADLKGVITFPAFARGLDVMTFVYVVRAWSGRLVPEGPEGTLHWVEHDDVASLDLWEGDRVFLPWLDRPGVFSARFEYDRGRFVRHEVAFYAASPAASSAGASDVNVS
jgi:8-oxo-dGTP diphosphatase